MDKRWVLMPRDTAAITSLHAELNIHQALCTLLTQRGIGNYNQAQQYFRPSMQQLHNPYLMKDMDKAVQRIITAIQQQQHILVYGDYDVDGTTSVAVVYGFLQHHCNKLQYYIPNRFSEGYGISQKSITYAIEQKVDVIIALDCGIKSVELITQAQAAGIDVIVADHHQPDTIIPPAYAILNPKQSDCPYPFKELCGCGIGYKLISCVEQAYQGKQELCNAHLDLVATAIAADIVPIVDENRILAYFGLQKANNNPSIPIQALKQITDLQKEFTITDLVFIVAPRVNAAGRMHEGSNAVALFLSENIEDAKQKALVLNDNNSMRQDVDKQTTAEALEQLQKNNFDLKYSNVLYQANWHKGVVGIVASRMIEHYYKPTIVLTQSNGLITGSARSIPGFNLFDGLSKCSKYLSNFGGHYFAAGLTLEPQHLPAFAKAFDEAVANTLQAHQFIPQLDIDAEVSLNEFNSKFFNIIEQMAPFGPQNMTPVFVVKNLKPTPQGNYVVKEKHLKLQLHDADGTVVRGIGFNLASKLDILNNNQAIDIACQMAINTWNGQTNIECKVLDIKPSEY
jgi:single-stranded-DNA-specific exonuclease